MHKKGRERTERLQALLAEPQTLNELCSFIAGGGTLTEWCKSNDVRYGETYAWLHDVDYPMRLEAYTKALEGRIGYFTDTVLSGLRDIAQADVRKLYDKMGKMIEPHLVPDELARVVVGVEEEETDRGVKRKLRLEGRKTGHELLGRSVGLYKDRVEHEGKLTLEDLVGGSHQGTPLPLAPGSKAGDPPPTRRSPRGT